MAYLADAERQILDVYRVPAPSCPRREIPAGRAGRAPGRGGQPGPGPGAARRDRPPAGGRAGRRRLLDVVPGACTDPAGRGRRTTAAVAARHPVLDHPAGARRAAARSPRSTAATTARTCRPWPALGRVAWPRPSRLHTSHRARGRVLRVRARLPLHRRDRRRAARWPAGTARGPSIPAGSVALGGEYTGIYPRASPGGWQVIGRTDGRDVGSWPRPGRPARGRRPGALHRRDAVTGRGIQVARPGALTTIQDCGRPGYAHLGVPRSGALDAPGPPPGQPAGRQPAGRAGPGDDADRGRGHRRGRRHGRRDRGAARPSGWTAARSGWARRSPAAGQILDVGPARPGVRSYVAFSGGLRVPPVLGSASTDLLSGLGPARLAAGDVLPLGDAAAGGDPGSGAARRRPGPGRAACRPTCRPRRCPASGPSC